MFEVKIMDWDDLPEEIRQDWSSDDEGEQYMLIFRNDELTHVFRDRLECEDVRYCRDLEYVPRIIKWAYKCGLEDGRKA
jgi:hypothetical protein